MFCPHMAMCTYEANLIMLIFRYCSIGKLEEKQRD